VAISLPIRRSILTGLLRRYTPRNDSTFNRYKIITDMDIYKETIIDHYQNPRNFGKINDAQQSISLNNPLCGDKITLYVNFQDNKLKEISFQAKGCAISIASASLLTDYVKGKSKQQLRKLDRDFIIKMLGIDLGVNRLKCALLPLEALIKILNLKL